MDHAAEDAKPMNSPEEPGEHATADPSAEPGGAKEGAGPVPGDEPALPPIPRELPILPVRNVVVFPGTVVPLNVGREKSRRLIDEVMQSKDRIVGVFAQRNEEIEDPKIDDVYRVGAAVQVLKLLPSADGGHSLLVHGIVRIGLEEIISQEPFWRALVNPHHSRVRRSIEIEALTFGARRTAERVIELSPNVPEEALQIVRSIEDPGALADFLSANLSLGIVQKQELLETFDVAERLRKVNATLQNQLEVLQLANKIQTDVRREIDKSQRQYYLQEQLKAIQKELGGADPRASELDELRDRLARAAMPEAVHKQAMREFERLERIPTASPENGIIRDYLDWLIEMPWRQETTDNLDLKRAEEILNEDHFGLPTVKRRILEALAVRALKPEGRGSILCFVGPPGVGKTSLGQSIARALGRKFIRIALGGVRDEADIRGHRRTYIGAIPGRIVHEIHRAGVRNPVLMLDEMDKLGRDFRGDPAAALLEVLDPEQNHNFTDHYLGVPFDLSRVFFIATANYMDPVEPALKDRLEVIDLPGYTTAEKVEIARRYLVPRQLERNGLAGRNIRLDDVVLLRLVEAYTREAGVRNLERTIGSICRGLAARVARGEAPPERVSPPLVRELLGPPRFEHETAMRAGVPGVATGLAYTPVGGDIIFVESTRMPGRGGFQLTGQIGDVMRESAQAALSLIRARARTWSVELPDLSTLDLHVHVPAGAVPKDGPSAGLAMVVSLFSMLTDQPADPSVGMTGEITLRGLVLPIGGVKEKVLAAHRAGLRTVILPARNEPDLHDVPENVRKEMRFILASQVEDALAQVFVAHPGAKRPPGPKPHRKGPPSGARGDSDRSGPKRSGPPRRPHQQGGGPPRRPPRRRPGGDRRAG